MSFFNFSGYTSPPRRPLNLKSPTSPFCTSPSQLQEVTFDQDVTLSDTMGLRSPNGPLRGRSVKEFEEQLTNLKKENFNLKLRIYFLEEKMGTNFTLDKDNVVKKNIELQVEIESLKKEIHEKHELLCMAVKAMELEEEEHKKMVLDREKGLNQCQLELEELRMQIKETKFDSDAMSQKSDTTGFFSSQMTNSGNLLSELQDKIKVMETELIVEKENNASLQILLGQSESLKTRNESLQKECRDKDEQIKKQFKDIELSRKQTETYLEQIEDLQQKLNISRREYRALSDAMQKASIKQEEIEQKHDELKKRYAMAKHELEQERRRSERARLASDSRVSELSEENDKQRSKIRSLQAKVEASLVEIKQSQNLAVPKGQQRLTAETDADCVSVAHAAAPAGAAQEDPLHVQVASASSPPSSPVPSRSFEQLEREHADQQKQIKNLRCEQHKACQIIKNMMASSNKAKEEIAQLKRQVKELEGELESVVTKPDRDGDQRSLRGSKQDGTETEAGSGKADSNENSVEELQFDEMDIAEQFKALTIELENKNEILTATLKEKENQMQNIHQQYEECLQLLEEKERKIIELEFELLSTTAEETKSFGEKQDVGTETRVSFYKKEMDEKDQKIKKLEEELKKFNCYLQEIVNTELWEKNKEIEKHNKKSSTLEISRLKQDLTRKEYQLKVLKEKISELGLEINISFPNSLKSSFNSEEFHVSRVESLTEELEQLKKERDYFKEQYEFFKTSDMCSTQDEVKKLLQQNEDLQCELEEINKLRLQSNDICQKLNQRLEELAIFLDTLLKQKLVLGLLGSKKNKRLQELVNDSLDLSKSFTMSMIINPDQSLAHLSNITALLDGSVFQDLTLDLPQDEPHSVLSIMPSEASLTYQSHMYVKNKASEPNERVITALREQVENLKSELQLRDNELNKLNNIKAVSTDKTTETDKEGFLNPSMCLNEVSKLFTSSTKSNTSTTIKFQGECHSESEAWSEPDRNVSRARMGLSQTLPSYLRMEKDNNVDESTEDESTSLPTDDRWNFIDKKMGMTDLHQQINFLEERLKEKTIELGLTEKKLSETLVDMERFKPLEEKLLITENELAKAEIKKAEAEYQIKKLQNLVDELSEAKKYLEESMIVKDKDLQNKINQLESEKAQISKAAKEFEFEAREAKNEIIIAEDKLKETQNQLVELEVNLRKEFELHAVSKLKVAEEEFIRRIKQMEENLEDRVLKIKEEYSKEYIRKVDVEKKMAELGRLSSELEELKTTVKSYEDTIDSYKLKEEEIRGAINSYQAEIKSLRSELDQTTLQYSEAVFQKTKLSNEKTVLEQELSKVNIKESELKDQFTCIQNELSDIHQSYQAQLGSYSREKALLESKICEMESTNAELHNRLIKLQVQREAFNASLPEMGKTIRVVSLRRQFSNDPNYSSEDNVEERPFIDYNRQLPINRPVDVERQEANSSPDLGIESDHGRFSSMEAQPMSKRPLQQTIELTESMSNLFDKEGKPLDDAINCGGGEHCCQNSSEILQENNELKRKLLRMRRALEETANQLSLANQRKKQVEKTICKQIHKTSQVLRKAKANLDSGSESDFNKI